jgi:pimeloyl-ACP methyl ester carboxylesterase
VGRVRRTTAVAVLAVAVAVQIVAAVALFPFAVSIGTKFIDLFPASGGPPTAIGSAEFSDAGPGTLVTATTMPAVTRTLEGRRLRAARVLYRSTSGDTSAPTVVSGSVFTPTGDAPPGGWSVVAIGHGTMGIDAPCGPSLSESLNGVLPFVTHFVKMGYAVVVPDYQGLGAKGVHPYPDSRTAGLNMIDAVRALRHTFGDVSDKWVAFGHSQGGGAAWAADEQAATYAPELDLVGAVAAAPAADVAGLVDKAQSATLTPDQRPVMQLIVESLARLHSDVNRDDYRRGAAKQHWEVLSACTGPEAYQRLAVIGQLQPGDFTPRTPAAADRLRQLLQRWSLPQKPLSAPLSVWYGGADTYVDAAWTAAAIARACALGGTVTIQFEPTKGHAEVDLVPQLTWITDRFAGKAVPNDC